MKSLYEKSLARLPSFLCMAKSGFFFLIILEILASCVCIDSCTPKLAEPKMPTGFVGEVQVHQVSFRWMMEREDDFWLANDLKYPRTLWHQQAIGTSNWGWTLLESGSKGLFWNSFLSCPQAALASRPRVWRTLAVTLRDFRAAANACTCQNNRSQNKINSTNETNFLHKGTIATTTKTKEKKNATPQMIS